MNRLTGLPGITPGIILGIALLIGSISSPTEASDWNNRNHEQHWHYGLGIGLSLLAYNDSNIATDFSQANNSSTLNRDDFAFKFFGGYRFDPFLALEVGISDLGATVATTNSSPSKLFNTYTVYIDTTMTHNYNDRAALFGKIGAHFWTLGPDRSTKLAEGTDLSLGAGLEFNLYGNTDRVMRIEWNRYLFDNIYLDTVDTLTLNLVFKH